MRWLIPIPMNRNEPGASLFIGAMNEMFPMSDKFVLNLKSFKSKGVSLIENVPIKNNVVYCSTMGGGGGSDQSGR